MKKIITMIMVILVLGVTMFTLTGCDQAETVTHNIQQDANKFSVYRKMTFINLRSDKILYSAEGYFSVQTTYSGVAGEELALVFKIGPDEYKMDYFSIANNVTYVIEQKENTHTNPYHWEIVWYVATPDIVQG